MTLHDISVCDVVLKWSPERKKMLYKSIIEVKIYKWPDLPYSFPP